MHPSQANNVPEISVILITPDTYETIRKTIQTIRLQENKDRIEVIIVGTTLAEMNPDEKELQDFARYEIVETGKIDSVGSAYAAGVRRANASIVALAEDHAFPQPGWAAGFIKSHQERYAVVGPMMSNANPNSLVSWADLLMAYSPWMEPQSAGPVNHLPGHNSCYRRSILLSYGSELGKMMEAESILHWDLRSKGYDLLLEPAARTLHTNFAFVSPFIRAHFHTGRQFAAYRAETQRWNLGRRLFYSAAAPLIPLFRLCRILKDVQRLKKRPTFTLAILPPLCLGLTIDAIGQFCGHLFGRGNSSYQLVALEFHRNSHQKRIRGK